MKPDIRSKLGAELAQDIVSERQVVYIMVELRKLLEVSNEKQSYPSLLFHCDWVAHVALERALAEQIVLAFNQQARMHYRMSKLALGEAMRTDSSFMALLGPTVTLTNFRNQLNTYLCLHGLDNSVADDNVKWPTFLRYYGEVIRDCPLRCIGNKLKFVDMVSVEMNDVAPATSEASGFTLRLRWTWTNKVTGREEFMQQFF